MNISIISDQVHNDLEIALPIIKEQGYTHIELHNVFNKSIEECNQNEVTKIKELLNQYDLKVSNIASTIFFLCPLYKHYRVSLFNPDFHAIEGDVHFHLHALENACSIAKELNCETIRIFPFRFPDNEDVIIVGTKEDQQQIICYLKLAVQIARQYDVTLVLENCPYSHCPKGEMTYDIIQAINDPHLQLLWDPANSYRCEIHKVPKKYLTLSLEDEYDLIKDKIRHIHLKNYHYNSTFEKSFVHTSLLDGDIDFHSLINKLKEDQYQHIVSLEPEVEFEDTIKSMHALKTML